MSWRSEKIGKVAKARKAAFETALDRRELGQATSPRGEHSPSAPFAMAPKAVDQATRALIDAALEKRKTDGGNDVR